MTLILKVHKFKYVSPQLLVWVDEAVNVAMNEVIYDDRPGAKTYITDALVTCVALAFYSTDKRFTTTFTHMSSASTVRDDQRKEEVLNQMLEYMLKSNSLSKIRILISPSTVKEQHLIDFLSA